MVRSIAGGSGTARATVAWTCVLLLGCSDRVDRVAVPVQSSDGGMDAGGAVRDTGTDAGDATAGDGGAPDACVDPQASAITLDGSGTLPEVAATTSGRALCTCEDYSGSARLEVRGALGVDGSMSQNGVLDAAGDVTITGAVGLSLGGNSVATVGGELAVGGPVLGVEASVQVSRDMRVGGRVQLQQLTVGGSLRQPASAALEVTAGVDAITIVSEPVTVAASCPCGDDNRLDPARLAALHTAVSDGGVFGEACAVARLRRDDTSPLQLEVTASASLLVDGDLAVDGDATIAVAAGATLDLFVTGNVRVDGVLDFGGAGAVRLYVAGEGTIELKGGGVLRGMLHAPDAELVAPAQLSIEGSALVRRVAAAADLDVGPR